MRTYCCGFLFGKYKNDPVNVLLIRKNAGWQKGILNGIGGKISKKDATAKEAMIREFQEEAGFPHEDWELTVIMLANKWQVFFFKSEIDMNDLPKEDFECDEGTITTIWIDELSQNITLPNLQWLIPMQLEDLNWPITLKHKAKTKRKASSNE